MNFCCYLLFFFNLILYTNLVKSRLRHIKVTHKNGVKTYVVNRQQFGTLKDAYKYSKIKSNTLKKARPLKRLVKKPIKSPGLRLRKKPMKKITKLLISRKNNKNAREKTFGGIEPVVKTPKSLVTVSPIIKPSSKLIKKITNESISTKTSENITATTTSTIKPTATTSTSTESPTTTASTTTSTKSPTTTTTTATTSTSTESPTTTTTTTTTTVTEDVDAQRLAKLYNSINNLRKKYNVPSLIIDRTFQEAAKTCVLKFEKDKKQWESKNEKIGLNFGSNAWNPDDAVDYWESTKKNYNYDNPVCNPNNREFVSMVWKSATDIGCGLGPGPNYRICCIFFPIGNFSDQKTLKDNVLKP